MSEVTVTSTDLASTKVKATFDFQQWQGAGLPLWLLGNSTPLAAAPVGEITALGPPGAAGGASRRGPNPRLGLARDGRDSPQALHSHHSKRWWSLTGRSLFFPSFQVKGAKE